MQMMSTPSELDDLHTPSSSSALLDWYSAYQEDIDMYTIINSLATPKLDDIPIKLIQSINMSYRQYLSKNFVMILSQIFTIVQLIHMPKTCVVLIVVPLSLRRK